MKIVYEQKLWDIDVAEKPEYELSLVVSSHGKKHTMMVRISNATTNTEHYLIPTSIDLNKMKKSRDVTPAILEFIKYAPVAINDYDPDITSAVLYKEIDASYEMLDTLYSIHKACCTKDLGEDEVLARLLIWGRENNVDNTCAGMNDDRTVYVDSENVSIVYNDETKIRVVLDAIDDYLEETLKEEGK